MRGNYGLVNFLGKDNFPVRLTCKIFKFCEEEFNLETGL